MYGPPHISLFTCMVAAAAVLAVSVAFNIDFTNPEIYDGKQEDFFGYKVLQFSSAKKKGVIVTSPLQLNGSGGICKYENSDPKCFRPDPLKTNATVVKYFGLSIAAAPSDTRFTVCSPSVAHECHKNTYLNSFCYKVSDDLEQLSFFKPLFQDCTKKTVDLVFLFDGSGSMTGSEFHQNKEFIKNIMSSLKNTSIKFAAVQFSSSHRKVFDFNEYKAGRALELLNKEPHMEELTNTHSALTFVLNKLFMNAAAGASPDATKVLVLITDGDPSDRDRSQIIKQYESKKIIRFVIGVKVKNMEKFKVIASEPKDKNVFKIEEYDGLKGILDNFQKRIFNVEGSTLTRAGNLTNEMSQSGFSAAYNKDTLVLGSVGSNSWGGALQEQRGQKEEQISDPEMHEDSYMGFSISVGERNGVSLYFSGAPRFEHKGQVVLFSRNAKNWTVIQRINDGQIGSYFGAELCSVDVDSDGSTDFLLVGAPLFFQPQEKREGRVYIYTLTDSLQLERGLSVTAPSMGRFGTTISSLADLNGDGLGDVAVGAPMEDENRGSVYIYLGDRYGGIRSTYSQRVMGEKFRPNMRFFGQAIDGHIDLGDDGLPDIVVGSQGAAVVLRSRPVFNVSARLSFQPQEISTEKIDCLGSSSENLPMVNLTLCFEMEEATKSKGGAASSGLNITYTLSIDPMRQTHRGLFSRTDRKAKNLTSTHNLINKETCFTYSTYMPKCVKDTLSPINIRLTFSQPDSENARASLNTDSRRHALVEVPFQKHCKKNDTCIAELEVDFSFISSTLVVKENNYFNVSISLNNQGDDSYNTSLTMFYPPGLSFSRMILSKASRPTLHGCNDLEGVSNQTVCGVSLPVYRSRSFVTFTSSFHILHKSEWNDTMTMTVTGQSDNLNSSIPIPSMTKSIPVQFEVNMASAVTEGSVTYLNFTLDDPAPKNMSTAFRIDNTGFKDFPVSVSLVFPIKLEHGLEVNDYQVLVQPNVTQCSSRPAQKSENCSAERCVHVECNTFNLRSYTAVEFWLVSKVQFKGLKERAGRIGFFQRYTGESREVRMKSYIKVDFDKQKYVLGSHKKEKEDPKKEAADLRKYSDPTIKSSEARVEYIFPPQKWLIVLTGTVLGFLLLLIIIIIMFKLGCFKRKTLEEFEEEFEEEHASHEGAPASGAAAKSEMDEESDEPTEEEAFMDTKANGSF